MEFEKAMVYCLSLFGFLPFLGPQIGIPKDIPLISDLFHDLQLKREIEALLVSVVQHDNKSADSQLFRPAPKLDVVQNLLITIAYCARRGHVIYGDDSSDVYVDTINRAYESREVCEALTFALHDLIDNRFGQRKRVKLDYVLCMEHGNVTLARAIAVRRGVPCLTLKADSNPSRAKENQTISPTTTEILSHFRINVQGLGALLDAPAAADRRQLNGIVVDCNCSGGSSLVRAAKEFNAYIQRADLSGRLAPLTQVFVLFRVDNEVPADKNFSNEGLKLYRHFDLIEAEKLKLAGIRTDGASFTDFVVTQDAKLRLMNVKQSLENGGRLHG